MDDRLFYIACEKCQCIEKHEVLAKYNSEFIYYDDGNDGEITYYYILKCQKCGNIVFLKQYYSSYNTKVIWDNEEKNYIPVDEDIKTIFPKPKIGFGRLYDSSNLPVSIRIIYNQTCDALANGSNVLAGIGMRGIVEALCNEMNIDNSKENEESNHLIEKINILVEKHIVSKNDGDTLHAIRVIGNDATHNTMQYASTVLIPCLKIIEQVLETEYFTNEALKNMKPFNNYEEFKNYVFGVLKNLKNNDEISIYSIWDSESKRRYGNKQSDDYKIEYANYKQRIVIDINECIKSGEYGFCIDSNYNKIYKFRLTPCGKDGDLLLKKVEI